MVCAFRNELCVTLSSVVQEKSFRPCDMEMFSRHYWCRCGRNWENLEHDYDDWCQQCGRLASTNVAKAEVETLIF